MNNLENLKKYLASISQCEFNIFKVLKIQDYEIRHSAVLAWLLNPNETHSIKGNFLSEFIKLRYNDILINSDNIKIKTEFVITNDDIDSILKSDKNINNDDKECLNKARDKRIDILVKSEDFILVIENKYGSGEHDSQCKCYKLYIEKKYPNLKNMFIYIDLDKDLKNKNNNLDGYQIISYLEILEILENITIDTKQKSFEFIQQYKQILQEQYNLITINNEKTTLEQVCIKINEDIYNKLYNFNSLEAAEKDIVLKYSEIIRYRILNILYHILLDKGFDNVKQSGARIVCAIKNKIYEFDNTKIGNNGSESTISLIIKNENEKEFCKQEFLDEDEYNEIFYLYGQKNRNTADENAEKILSNKLKIFLN